MSDIKNSGPSKNSPSDIAREAKLFLENKKTLQLATVNGEGLPLASYTPYVLDSDHNLGILTSRLARHTENLLNERRCSVILLQDEASAHNPFARQRLSFLCRVRHYDRNSAYFDWLVRAMGEKFGPIANQLSQLPDFEAFQLTPESAEFVKGFGSAWRFKNAHLNEASLIKPER